MQTCRVRPPAPSVGRDEQTSPLGTQWRSRRGCPCAGLDPGGGGALCPLWACPAGRLRPEVEGQEGRSAEQAAADPRGKPSDPCGRGVSLGTALAGPAGRWDFSLGPLPPARGPSSRATGRVLPWSSAVRVIVFLTRAVWCCVSRNHANEAVDVFLFCLKQQARAAAEPPHQPAATENEKPAGAERVRQEPLHLLADHRPQPRGGAEQENR